MSHDRCLCLADIVFFPHSYKLQLMIAAAITDFVFLIMEQTERLHESRVIKMSDMVRLNAAKRSLDVIIFFCCFVCVRAIYLSVRCLVMKMIVLNNNSNNNNSINNLI